MGADADLEASMDGPDLIESGAAEPASALRRRAVALVAALLALAVVAAGADQLLRMRESEALLRATAGATATAGYADRRVLAVADYSAPALFGADTSPDVRASLVAVVQREAADLAPSVRAGATGVGGVRVLPWHRDVRTARTDAAGYLRARADILDAVAHELGALYAPAPAATRARERARESLLGVVRGSDAAKRVGDALSGSAP